MVQPTCRTLRPRLIKVVAAASGFVDQFSREHPHALVNTIFWAMNYEITRPLELFVQNYCMELQHNLYVVIQLEPQGYWIFVPRCWQNVSCEISK
jgi:hypothetical protein